MYLSKVRIQNFRCFDDQGVEVEFQPGVNVVIGENNTGKSALIDVLRLAFSLGPGRREITVNPEDFHILQDGTRANDIAFDLTFSDLTEDEEFSFFEMWVPDQSEAQLHIRYRLETVVGTAERPRTTYWGGVNEGQTVGPETLEYINHIFLGALRDAERHLRPGRGSRIGQLLRRSIVSEEDQNRILGYVRAANRAIMADEQVREAGDLINTNLESIEGARLRQEIQLGLAPPDFGRVADSLRPLVSSPEDFGAKAIFAEREWNELLSVCPDGADVVQAKAQTQDGKVIIDLSDISASERKLVDPGLYAELRLRAAGVLGLEQNGMGYNNLIYMGTALGDLQEWKRVAADSYNALLIEEPEAHLHPQLQDLVLGFLGRVSRGTQLSPGQIQVFITSHSPTLTSRASLDSLIVLYRHEGSIEALPIRKCPLEPSQKADLARYLDVTKCQLFFGKGVMLVEGISEALLLPVFARLLGRRLDHNAVEVVNVGGTSFAPFACLFNSEDPENRCEIPCGILTDDDRCSVGDDEHRLTSDDLKISFVGKSEEDAEELVEKLDKIQQKLNDGPISYRATNALALEGGNLAVSTAYKTFEYEIALPPQNADSLLEALGEIRPRVAGGLRVLFASPLLTSQHKAICLWLAIRRVKAEFAQRLAALLDERNETGEPRCLFTVPNYVVRILEHLAPVEAPSPS